MAVLSLPICTSGSLRTPNKESLQRRVPLLIMQPSATIGKRGEGPSWFSDKGAAGNHVTTSPTCFRSISALVHRPKASLIIHSLTTEMNIRTEGLPWCSEAEAESDLLALLQV